MLHWFVAIQVSPLSYGFASNFLSYAAIVPTLFYPTHCHHFYAKGSYLGGKQVLILQQPLQGFER